MSSNNNNDSSGIAIVFGLLAAAAYVLLIAAAVFVMVTTVVLTIIAIMAWNRPLRFHKWVITPAEARDFIKRGLVGAYVLPMLLAAGDLLFGWNINWNYLFYFMLGGYCAGSVGLEMLFGDEEREGPLFEYLPPQQDVLPPPPARASLPAPKPEPFRFAEWDDEAR